MTVASDVIPAAKRAEGMGYYGVASVAAMSLGPALRLFLIKSTTPSTLFITASVVAAVGLGASLLVSYEKSPEVIARRAAIRPTRAVVLEKTALPPSLVLLFITLTYGGIISFIPLYAGSRGVQNIGLFFTVYAIVLLFSRPLIGRLADRLGGRWFLPPGILVIVVALVLLTRANSLTLFLLCGAIYGLGFAAVQPILSALIVSLAPPERRGAANATFAIAMDLGIGLGSILMGFIIQKLGYESMYGISAIFAGVALVVYYALLRKRMPHHPVSAKTTGKTISRRATGAS
jgi:MFS family permease